jgi:glycosyltransferase involved in cell wall biosynthesis
MCEAFAAEGHDVTAVARAGDDDVDAFDAFGVSRSFTLLRVPPARMRGVRTVAFEHDVTRVAAAVSPDLIYTRDVYSALVLSNYFATIVEFHRTMENYPAELFSLRWMMRRHRLRRVVVVSEGMARWYRQNVDDLSPLVVPGAADDPGAPPPISRRTTTLRLGYVGRLYAGRGAEILLAIAQRLPTCELHIVGAEAAEVAGEIPTNVIFHGHVPHRDVPAQLHSFDVLLAPYQQKVYVDGGAETAAVMSPLKLFEYLAAGRAVIASDLAVLREVLDDSVAVLCPPENIDAWVAAVHRLMDLEVRAALGIAGRKRFLERHTWRQRAAQVLA